MMQLQDMDSRPWYPRQNFEIFCAVSVVTLRYGACPVNEVVIPP